MSTGKKQQTISSFFKAKPSHPTPSSTAVSTSPSTVSESPFNASTSPTEASGSIFVTSDEDEDPVLSKSSSTKRRLNQISENVAESPSVSTAKKQKTISKDSTAAENGEYEGSEVTLPVLSAAVPKVKEADSKITDRTSKYLFSTLNENGETSAPNENEDDEETLRQKEKMHRKFVKKLGRPDSINEIKRRNHFIDDANAEGEEGADDEDPEDEPQNLASSAKRGASAKKAGQKLTPMEKQVVDIKKKHPDAVLVVEVGYKFRFFGEDARIAAKELSIVCIPGKYRFDSHPSEAHLDRFASASIPVHRLHVHVKRLVQAGHKVGVVRQLETAALKAAGDNRNAPFVRQLTNLYTKGTYIDDVEGLEGPAGGKNVGSPTSGYLLCITETNAKGWGTDEKVHVGLVAVQPATGDIIYDDFEDGFMRGEIETRLLHVSPCEFLIVGDLSKATEKLIHHLSGSKTNVFGDKARVERVDKPKNMTAQAYNHVSSFYAEKLKADKAKGSENGAEGSQKVHILDKVHKLSDHVTVCLSAMITHLGDYGLHHVFDLTKNFQAFSARSHMLLNANTLNSLEIYRNSTDYSERGSLFWVLDQTRTRFGQRLLRKWVGRPLLDIEKLQERTLAVEELKDGERTAGVDQIKSVLGHIKYDLEKSLLRIYYKRCSRPELLNVLQSMQRIATEYAHVQSAANGGFQSQLINDAVATLPKILDDVVAFLDMINTQAAKEDDKYSFFREEHESSDISEHKSGIATVEAELEEYKTTAAEKLRKKRIDYVTVAGIDYLIEVDNSYLKNVPASWVKISGTKKVSRFHSPEVIRLIKERDQHKESLAAACNDAFTCLLTEISSKYHLFRDCIQSLATLDSLMSLAEVASRPDYVKPSFTKDIRISVQGGRHPMVEQLLLDSYVPNDIDLSSSGTRALLVTGPNMGGKSSYVRQVALISIMGQIGSYVPAVSAELGLLDAVFTRMGAFDNMMAGESTFMVELSETSDILKQATPRSLVILDELGRGTSTHDGVAIAHAVLDYVVRESGALLLFITHYQTLSAVAEGLARGELKNMHMRFTEEGENEQDITFLYELGEGTAHRSYGLNVARLANVPANVIETARAKSKEMEMDMKKAKLGGVISQLDSAGRADQRNMEDIVQAIETL